MTNKSLAIKWWKSKNKNFASNSHTILLEFAEYLDRKEAREKIIKGVREGDAFKQI